MVKNELTKEITLTHTPTSYWLLQQDPDAFVLYQFYCYTASWQENQLVYATREFTKKALGWGNERYHKAKNILIQGEIISDEQAKNEDGQIIGNYIWVRTVGKTHLSSNLQVDTKTPNNTIIKENIKVVNPIVNTVEEAEDVLGDSDSLKERLRMKKELRAKKNARLKSSFISPGFGVRPTKGGFEQKRREGVNAEDIF